MVLALSFQKRPGPEIPLAQLRLKNMKLHGREGDVDLLKAKLRRLAAQKENEGGGGESSLSEMILVAGVSGTGKSALVARGLREPTMKMGMAFGGGKFDQNDAALPLSALSEAMTSLAKQVLTSEHRGRTVNSIQGEFGADDLTLLSDALPKCGELLGRRLSRGGTPKMERAGSNIRVSISKQVEGANLGGQTGKELITRQQFAICRLLKIICTNLGGVVLFIDDLQWSDNATLGLLQRISLDDSIPSLLVVGAYRKDEVSQSHPLTLHIRDLEHLGVSITTLEIGNLSSENVKHLVAEALGMEGDEDAVDTLSATIHAKTEGNVFFVLMFLRSLHEEELLSYNIGLTKWIWDDNSIKAKLVTENVATIMVKKLKRMDRKSQEILAISSCLGAKFSVSVLATVYSNMSGAEADTDENASAISDSLVECEEEGLLESDSAEVSRFSHDKIQAASFELIPTEKRDSYRGEIGGILAEKLDAETLEEFLFEVTSLRNCAIDALSETERIELAAMNLQAGMKAISMSSFDSAVVYLRVAREILGDFAGKTAWDVDPEAMLQLCSEEANCCFINGDTPTMNFLINEVLSRDIPVVGKFRVYEVKILAALGAADFHDAADTALSVRRQLGLSSPRNKPTSKLTVLYDYVKTQCALKNKSAQDIASLPELKDEKIIMGQRLLETLLESIYMVQPSMYPLVVSQIVRDSLKHGINASSCDGFNTFGLLLCGAFGGRLKQAQEMAKASELILKNPSMARMKSRAAFLIEGCITWWLSPVQSVLSPLLQGYQVGLDTGDVGSACYNLLFRASAEWFSSRPLAGLQKGFEANVTALERLNQVGQKWGILVYLLAVKQLRGVRIGEEDINYDTIMAVVDETKNMMLRSSVYAVRLELLVISQEWKAATALLHKAGDLRPSLPDIAHIRFTYMETLICLKNAQTTSGWSEKRIWKKRSEKLIELIRSWVKKGNANLVHCSHLVTAQYGALRGKKNVAEDNFKAAVKVASRNGFLHDRALSHELASRYYTDQGETEWAGYHFERAKRSYLDWGAIAKVDEMSPYTPGIK